MQWIEITIHTNTNGADAMADVFFSLGIAGVSIEDADVILVAATQEAVAEAQAWKASLQTAAAMSG